MFRLFKSDFFNFEALRLLSFTAHEGGEVAEFFEALGKIKDLNTESWYAAWTEAALKAEALAAEAELAGNRAAARKAFFRASNYQRAAQFMLNGRYGNDTRILRDSENAISNFWRAATLLDSSITRLEIPYDGHITLPAYLHIPHPSKRLPGKLPLLINTVGADATQEEIFYIFPMAALELGYAVLTFEGPGQGIVLRKHNLPFRPDWEFVVSKVLDFAVEQISTRAELDIIDTDRIALAGSSMGGYLALRGASDPRIKACIAVDPFYSMWDLLKGRMPDAVINTFLAGGFAPDPLWDRFLGLLKWWDVQTRWESDLTCWMLGVDNAAAMFRRMMQFSFATADGEGFLHKVKCPVFVTGARFSLYCQPEISTMRIYSELLHVPEDKKVAWVGEDAGRGGLQSKVGAFGVLNQKAFAFLDNVFEIHRRIVTGNAI
jgi:pimeloyl-ACP methyl ester carboxylesterase